jgi:hypothetical protein
MATLIVCHEALSSAMRASQAKLGKIARGLWTLTLEQSLQSCWASYDGLHSGWLPWGW